MKVKFKTLKNENINRKCEITRHKTLLKSGKEKYSKVLSNYFLPNQNYRVRETKIVLRQKEKNNQKKKNKPTQIMKILTIKENYKHSYKQ